MTPIAKTPEVWDDARLASPHTVADKHQRVQRMFTAIAPSYDLNNRLHSMGLDQSWRRRAVRLASIRPGDTVVDVACGTGDLALQFRRALGSAGKTGDSSRSGEVIGIDFTHAMLPIAHRKALAHRTASSRKNDPPVAWLAGDAQTLPLADACADIVSIAFGIRNVADPAAAISEFFRILRPGGRLVILEFSLPANPMLRGIYNFYFHHILPRTATWISGDRTGAYRYLPTSVNTFIGPEALVALLRQSGFQSISRTPMSCGICVGYLAIKT